MLLKNNKTVAFIPVRGGSKSIPLKNICNFCGKPLVYWTAMAASKCDAIDEVYIATDSDVISETINKLSIPKVYVIGRSNDTASDTASTESAMLEFANNIDFHDIVLIQATSPLLSELDLSGGINKYRNGGFDSLLSVVPQKRFIWNDENGCAYPQNYNPLKRPRRQEMDEYYVENGAFYITTRQRLLTSGCRISGKLGMYSMSAETYFEIDEPADWKIMELLKKKRFVDEPHMIKLLITDVDGTLTDAGMYYDVQGNELKKFNARDGKGLELLRKYGVKVMLLTSEDTPIVENRARKLQVDYCFMGVKNKAKFLDDFFMEHPEFSYNTSAYIGDDVNDLEAMSKMIISAAPSDAVEEIKETADYQCIRSGGNGCVREFCDYIRLYKRRD